MKFECTKTSTNKPTVPKKCIMYITKKEIVTKRIGQVQKMTRYRYLEIESVLTVSIIQKVNSNTHMFKFDLNFYDKKLGNKNQKKVAISGEEALGDQQADFDKHL